VVTLPELSGPNLGNSPSALPGVTIGEGVNGASREAALQQIACVRLRYGPLNLTSAGSIAVG
jgi:hypothetical protein